MSLGYCEPKSNLMTLSTYLLWFFWETGSSFCPSLLALKHCCERGNAVTGFSSIIISLIHFLQCFIQRSIEHLTYGVLSLALFVYWSNLDFVWCLLKGTIEYVGEAWGPGGRCWASFCQNGQLPFYHHVLRYALQCIFAIDGVVWSLYCVGWAWTLIDVGTAWGICSITWLQKHLGLRSMFISAEVRNVVWPA